MVERVFEIIQQLNIDFEEPEHRNLQSITSKIGEHVDAFLPDASTIFTLVAIRIATAFTNADLVWVDVRLTR